MALVREQTLTPCKHQVAGHWEADGEPGCLVDGNGRFYKPLQDGLRGERERAFYELVRAEREASSCIASASSTACHATCPLSPLRCSLPGILSGHQPAAGRGCDSEPSTSGRASIQGQLQHSGEAFCIRNAPLLAAIPAYYGVQVRDGRRLLQLEDVAQRYRRPCIMDVKLGFQTWYPCADPAYVARCRAKDTATTQAAMGFRICGMQVCREGAYWRASKAWCKGLQQGDVHAALRSFVDTGCGLQPQDVYGSASGAVAQLQRLASWFQVQRDFCFYSASVLLMYEGEAGRAEGASVSARLIDFAHTFAGGGQQDTNCLRGMLALMHALDSVAGDRT